MTANNLSPWKIEDDFSQIAEQGARSFEALQNAHIFLTGGTGFIGSWFLEAIAYVNDVRQGNIEVTVLTRNPMGFEEKNSRLFSDP